MWKLWRRFRRAGSVTSIAAFLVTRYGHLTEDRVLAALIGVFITYHIFLAVLVFTEEKLSGMKVHIGLAILIHLAFLSSFVALCFALQETPFLPFLKLVLPLLAFLEMRWIFGPGKLENPELAPQQSVTSPATPIAQREFPVTTAAWVPVTSFFASSASTATAVEPAGKSGVTPSLLPSLTSEALAANAGDYDEFLQLVQKNIRPYRRPGRSLDEEFQRWRAARPQHRTRARAST
jgi:hypothetical protein